MRLNYSINGNTAGIGDTSINFLFTAGLTASAVCTHDQKNAERVFPFRIYFYRPFYLLRAHTRVQREKERERE